LAPNHLALMKLLLEVCFMKRLRLPAFPFYNFFEFCPIVVGSLIFSPYYCARGRAIVIKSRFDNL
jgi:hypothetical protein